MAPMAETNDGGGIGTHRPCLVPECAIMFVAEPMTHSTHSLTLAYTY